MKNCNEGKKEEKKEKKMRKEMKKTINIVKIPFTRKVSKKK